MATKTAKTIEVVSSLVRLMNVPLSLDRVEGCIYDFAGNAGGMSCEGF